MTTQTRHDIRSDQDYVHLFGETRHQFRVRTAREGIADALGQADIAEHPASRAYWQRQADTWRQMLRDLDEYAGE